MSRKVLSLTAHAFIESEVCFRPINASQAEAPPPSHGVHNGEMIYSFANLLFGTWMPGNQVCEKRMMGFLDCHLERLAIQQILNEATGGISCLKTPLPDSQRAAHNTARTELSFIRARYRLRLCDFTHDGRRPTGPIPH
jgi:hypothetical protein